LFLLITGLFAEGKADPSKAVMCGVASPAGNEWFDDFEEANIAYGNARVAHDGLAFLACMPSCKADVYVRSTISAPLSAANDIQVGQK
jgi:hypothetical protein